MKPIRLSAHAQGYLESRGFTVAEVEEAIRLEAWEPAERGRLQCRRELAYSGLWHGKRYAHKQVRPIFVELEAEILVVTVYTYYY